MDENWSCCVREKENRCCIQTHLVTRLSQVAGPGIGGLYAGFKELLQQVDRSYEDFVRGVLAYTQIPGNEDKQAMIEDYIINHPKANSSDVLEYLIKGTGFVEQKHKDVTEVVA